MMWTHWWYKCSRHMECNIFDAGVLLRVTDYLYDSFTSTCLQFHVSVGNILFYRNQPILNKELVMQYNVGQKDVMLSSSSRHFWEIGEGLCLNGLWWWCDVLHHQYILIWSSSYFWSTDFEDKHYSTVMEVWKRKSHHTTVTDNVQQTLFFSLAYLVIL